MSVVPSTGRLNILTLTEFEYWPSRNLLLQFVEGKYDLLIINWLLLIVSVIPKWTEINYNLIIII